MKQGKLIYILTGFLLVLVISGTVYITTRKPKTTSTPHFESILCADSNQSDSRAANRQRGGPRGDTQ